MNLFRTVAFAAAFLAGSATAVSADQPPVNLAVMTLGYSYFNKPGVDLATHNAEVVACRDMAALTRPMDEVINSGGGMGILGAAIGGAIANAYYRGSVGSALENCMVVRGWRVVRLEEAEGKALAVLSQEEVAARIAPWVGADTPHGEVVRVWNNDAAKASSDRYAIRPEHLNHGPLSLKAATGQILADVTRPPAEKLPVVKLDKKWPKATLKPAKIASAPPEAAILVAGIVGVSQRNGVLVGFRREGPDDKTPPSTIDNAPDVINFAIGTLFAKKGGNFFAVAVPPGRWRVSNLGLLPSMNFCLGSPSVEVKAGEVVYLGMFDLGSENFGPSLDLAPAKAFLAGQPAAEAIKPAVYANGSTGMCGDSFIYALEIDGAPFEPGYVWGGAAAASQPAPTEVAEAP